MILKPGVRIVHRELAMPLLLLVAHTIYAEAGWPLILTSACDGVHSRGSGHYRGDAFDTRVRDPGDAWSIPQVQREEMHRKAVEALRGQDFVVILKPDHFHWQWRPLEAYA